MASGSLKLCVELVSAHNLMAKDGQGSSSPYVELHFDGKKLQSTVREKDLNPVWNESFYFSIPDPAILRTLALEAYVYNNNAKEGDSRRFLGKVSISGASFVPSADAVILHYPLEKRGVFSRVRGELALKLYVTDDPTVKVHHNNGKEAKQIEMPAFSEGKQREEVSAEAIRKPVPESVKPGGKQNTVPKPDVSHELLHPATEYVVDAMKAPETAAPNVVKMNPAPPPQPVDYALKETSPLLGGGHVVGGRVVRRNDRASAGTYDLVEKMQYLFVRVVKARDLPAAEGDPYVEVRIGNYKGVTKHIEKQPNPVWDIVFAFSRERIQAAVVEVEVKDKAIPKDEFVGLVKLDFHEVPVRVPPDSPLAPEWYCLMDKKGDKIKGDLMLSVWIGTQADEAFPDACHSDAASSIDSMVAASTQIRSKVYHAPRLWYVRVSIIEAQDMIPQDKTRILFVSAEPFEDPLILTVEDRVAPGKEETIGRIIVPLNMVPKRADDRILPSRWFNLEKAIAAGADQGKDSFSGRVHIRACLEGGYHVLNESTHYSSDLRPSAKQLWKPAIGVLELGILNAAGLHPMKTRDGKGTSDTYCVAKYGHKWVRTRTVMDNLSPKYNEQYVWEVFDPATVLTVGVFDNNQLIPDGNIDKNIGKVRIRISTLQTGRVYTHSYPLLVLHPSGVKKMGELHLAIRFSCTSFVNMLHVYSMPLLPKMHYIMPFTMMQLEILRHQAVNIVATRLARAEPPLRREIVEYMCDVDSHLWSMRKSKANFFRLTSIFGGVIAAGSWFRDICLWKNPITTVLVHALYLMLISFPDLILSTTFLYMFLIGMWNFRFRPRHPPHMSTKISQAEIMHPDELDEEFDTFPTQNPDLVKLRYDRLRSLSGRIQTVVGDIATQGERFQSILSWRDPRATTIFLLFCIAAALILYVTPFQIFAALGGMYVMRHPNFRHRFPCVTVNFFRRLPARTDGML